MSKTITPARIRKTGIFFKRVNGKPSTEDRVINTSVDALYACLSDLGRVDLGYIQTLISVSEDELIAALQNAECKVKDGDEWTVEQRSLIFYDPHQQKWVTRDEYLSGNTRKKLEFLEGIKEITPDNYEALRLSRNEEALKLHLPKFLLPPTTIDPDIRAEIVYRMGGEEQCDLGGKAYIDLRLGSPVLLPEDIQEFCGFLLDRYTDEAIRAYVIVDHVPELGHWAVDSKNYGINQGAKTSEYAIDLEDSTADGIFRVERNLFWVLSQALNNTVPRIEVKRSSWKGEYLDREATHKATEAARYAIDKIKQAFAEWVWSDIERAHRLTVDYNEAFPRLIRRKYDGSHLKLPGSNPLIQLNPWQLNGVWRSLQSGTTLFAWEVGTGKSFAMIASAMEARRMGLCRKPMLVCLNGTEEQLAADFLRLYPEAKLLVATEKSFERQNRRNLIAKIRSGDWDCVIIAHSQFFAIPVFSETREAYIQEELAKLEQYSNDADGSDRLLKRVIQEQMGQWQTKIGSQQVLESARKAALRGDTETINTMINEGKIEITKGNRFAIPKKAKTPSQKELDRASKRVTAQVDAVMDNYRKDPVVFWETLGVDWVALDEAHVVKNLPKSTKLRYIAGLPNSSSQRSLDALIKFQHTLSEGGKVIFATGTPCSNSMGEWWVIQRFLGFDRLKSTLNLDHFDNWAQQFGEIRTEIEITHTGGMKPKTRFARFTNLFILSDFISEFSDFVRADIVGLERPKPNYITIAAPPGDDQLDFLDEILERNEALNRRQPHKYVNKKGETVEDNALTLTNLGSLNALDARLVKEDAQNWYEGKLNQVLHNAWWIWKESRNAKMTQLIFSDLGVPGGNDRFNAYHYLRDGLIALGVPPEEIAIIHEYKRNERKPLFKKIRSGQVRFMICSTAKGGTGVNVQDRCIAAHDVSIPWTPAQIDQRRGRLHRQGNLNPEVYMFVYVTEGRNNQPGFDAFKVQTVETKANFLSQFLSGEVTSNDFEDDGADAMSYHLVKALAAGDPAIMEYAKITDQLKRLEIESNSIASKLARDGSALRGLPRRLLVTEKYLEACQYDLEVLQKYHHQLKANSDLVHYEAEGETFTNALAAGEFMVSQMKAMSRSQKDSYKKLGDFCGFEVYASYYGGSNVKSLRLFGAKYVIEGEVHYTKYDCEPRFTPSLLIDILRHTLMSGYRNVQTTANRAEQDRINALSDERVLPDRIATLKSDLETVQEQIRTLKFREAELKEMFTSTESEAQAASLNRDETEDVSEGSSDEAEGADEGAIAALYQGVEPEVIQHLKSRPEPTAKDIHGNVLTWIPRIREIAGLLVSNIQNMGQAEQKVIDLPVTRPVTRLVSVQGGRDKQRPAPVEKQLSLFEMFA